jgi:hypothetical protein
MWFISQLKCRFSGWSAFATDQFSRLLSGCVERVNGRLYASLMPSHPDTSGTLKPPAGQPATVSPSGTSSNAARKPNFETVREQLEPNILAFLTIRCFGEIGPEDVAQEVWIKAMVGWDRFEGDANDAKAWVYQIARNHLTDVVRRVSRHTTTALDKDIAVSTPEISDDVDAEGHTNQLALLPLHYAWCTA